ncbi:MAG TPA: hypothetical protein VH969_27785 [Actinophytocola sp.]
MTGIGAGGPSAPDRLCSFLFLKRQFHVVECAAQPGDPVPAQCPLPLPGGDHFRVDDLCGGVGGGVTRGRFECEPVRLPRPQQRRVSDDQVVCVLVRWYDVDLVRIVHTHDRGPVDVNLRELTRLGEPEGPPAAGDTRAQTPCVRLSGACRPQLLGPLEPRAQAIKLGAEQAQLLLEKRDTALGDRQPVT